VGHIEKIESLEKQLSLFREEALTLFEKMNEKERIIYNLETKINEIESEKRHLEQRVKTLTKRNKELEGNKAEANYYTIDQGDTRRK
jgi:peptidoglycan hydrolase CwlO-like protein